MLIDKITSRQNPLIKRFRDVRQNQERHLILIEGIRLVEEAIKAQLHFEVVAYTDRLHSTERGQKLYNQLLNLSCRGALVTESIMTAMSDVNSPQGVAAITHIPYATIEDAINKPLPLVIVAHQLQDPGNIGTIIRTAQAIGADSLITTLGTVNPFNLKALRASMGAAFRLPIILNLKSQQLVEFCQTSGLQIITTSITSGKEYTSFNWKAPLALILGSEASGVDLFLEKASKESVFIPMSKSVESLNVATAGAVLLYEAARQRGFIFS
ncbi:MAG: RNA methyltransferase [Acidobacteria bacterium]|nr:RNA methyltransferase [Acidobacteriota bacterium]